MIWIRYEQSVVSSMLGLQDGTLFWIGLSDQVSPGQYAWSDNTDVTYTHWDVGQPSKIPWCIYRRVGVRRWWGGGGGEGEIVYIYNITDNPDLIFCTFCLVMKMMMFMITRVITYLENDHSSNSNQGYTKDYDVYNLLIADAWFV